MATYSIAADADDGYVYGTNLVATTTGINLGIAGGTAYSGWFRFAGIAAAQGATCASAYITFMASGSGSGDMLSAFYGVAEDNHVAPTTKAHWDTDHGIHTTAKVDFDFTDGKTAGNVITSPSLVTIFDEIFSRAGWSTGNAVGIHWENDGATGTVYRSIAMRENTTRTEAVLTLTLNAGAGLSIPVAMQSYRQRRV